MRGVTLLEFLDLRNKDKIYVATVIAFFKSRHGGYNALRRITSNQAVPHSNGLFGVIDVISLKTSSSTLCYIIYCIYIYILNTVGRVAKRLLERNLDTITYIY